VGAVSVAKLLPERSKNVNAGKLTPTSVVIALSATFKACRLDNTDGNEAGSAAIALLERSRVFKNFVGG